VIDFDGSITWDNQAVPNLKDSRYALQRKSPSREDQDEIHVAPNRLVKYDTVAKGCTPTASRHRVKKIGFTGEEAIHAQLAWRGDPRPYEHAVACVRDPRHSREDCQ